MAKQVSIEGLSYFSFFSYTIEADICIFERATTGYLLELLYKSNSYVDEILNSYE